MNVSVIVPSRLAANPMSADGNLWLDRAMQSIKHQDVSLPIDVLICVDPGMSGRVPPRFTEPGGRLDVHVIEGKQAGQAHALNAGLDGATGDVLAILEDDDYWCGNRLSLGLPLLERFDFVSSNQREIDEQANFCSVNDFATPSGWIWPRRLGLRFDPGYRWHLDNDVLGEVTRRGLKRAHQVEQGAADEFRRTVVPRPWLDNVANVGKATLVEIGQREPLINRTVHAGSGMARIAAEPAAKAQSDAEYDTLIRRYGVIPW